MKYLPSFSSWFRMHAAFAFLPPIQMLSEADQRRYVMCLCLHCDQTSWPLPDDQIAWFLRIEVESWKASKEMLIKHGLMDESGALLQWEALHQPCDPINKQVEDPRTNLTIADAGSNNPSQSAERGVTNDSPGSLSEPVKSLSSSSTRIPKIRLEPPGFVQFWQNWPRNVRKGGRAVCLKAWIRCDAEAVAEHILAHVNSLKGTDEWQRDGGQYIPAPSRYLSQQRWTGTDFDFQSPQLFYTQPPTFKLEEGHYVLLSSNDRWTRVATSSVPSEILEQTSADRERFLQHYRFNGAQYEHFDPTSGWRSIHQFQVPDWIIEALIPQKQEEPIFA